MLQMSGLIVLMMVQTHMMIVLYVMVVMQIKIVTVTVLALHL